MMQIFLGDSGRDRRLGALPEFHPPTEMEHLPAAVPSGLYNGYVPPVNVLRCRADQTRQRFRWLLQRQGGVAREGRLRADSSQKSAEVRSAYPMKEVARAS